MPHPQVTLSMSKELPVVVEYRISDIGHISCAPSTPSRRTLPVMDQCLCLPGIVVPCGQKQAPETTSDYAAQQYLAKALTLGK